MVIENKIRKIIALTVILLILGPLIHAQKPFQNEGFENWEKQEHFDEPINWRVNFFSYLFNSQAFVQKSSDSYSGNFALRLLSDTASTSNDVQSPGELNLSGSDLNEGLNYTSKVDSIVFYAKYNIAKDDSTAFTAKFTENDQVIDSSRVKFIGQSNGYERISVPYDFKPADPNPDSLYVNIVGSLGSTEELSTILIDSIHVKGGSQKIPNGGFENWQNYSTKTPQRWSSFNSLSFYLDEPIVQQSTDSKSGNYAVTLSQRQIIFFLSLDTLGLMSSGSIGGNFDFRGVPVGDKPRYATLFHKYDPNGNDTGAISIVLEHYDPQGDTSIIIGGGAKAITSQNSSYKKSVLPIRYDTSLSADTMLVLFNAGSKYGTELTIDDLSVNYACSPSSATVSRSVCDSFIAPSGQEVYTKDGTYKDTLINSQGCDSIITINLTIKEVDSSATQSGSTLEANTSGGTYQWLDCDNGYAEVSGATSQSFKPSSDGRYAVAVTQNNCTDTSSCYQVETTGIAANGEKGAFEVYPNPAADQLNIVQQGNAQPQTFELQTLTGKRLKTGRLSGTERIDVTNLSPGVYLLQVQGEDAVRTKKVVIE